MTLLARRTFLTSVSSAAFFGLVPAPALGLGESFPEGRLSHSDIVVMGLYARDQNLRPFRRQIFDLVASAVGAEPGIEAGWHRQWVQRYVEDYVLQFGALPDGHRRVQVFWGGNRDLGSIDFGRPEKIASESLVAGRSWETLELEDVVRVAREKRRQSAGQVKPGKRGRCSDAK